jgi:hypothetical protein
MQRMNKVLSGDRQRSALASQCQSDRLADPDPGPSRLASHGRRGAGSACPPADCAYFIVMQDAAAELGSHGALLHP